MTIIAHFPAPQPDRPPFFVGVPSEPDLRRLLDRIPVASRPAVRDRVVELGSDPDLRARTTEADRWRQAITEARRGRP